MEKKTAEEIKKEAEKLGLTLTDEQVKAHVLLGTMPVKDSSTNDDDDDDELNDDDKNEKEKTQKRIKELLRQKKEAIKGREDLQSQIDELKKVKDKADTSEAEKKGEYDKLLAQLSEKIGIAEQAVGSAQEQIKQSAIRGHVESKLLALGVSKEFMKQAKRLFDDDSIDFEWSDKEKMTYEINEDDTIFETFKKENPFLFSESNDDDDDDEDKGAGGGGFKPTKIKDRKKSGEKDDEKLARLRKQVPALNNLS